MELSNLLTGPATTKAPTLPHNPDPPRPSHPPKTMSGINGHNGKPRMATPPTTYGGVQSNSTTPHTTSISPYANATPKSVSFELWESPQYRARLPMRVQIFPHDTTESIITTVRNFYGLYAGHGGAKSLSFEDEQGNTLIAHYENLRNNMIVYVRVIDGPSSAPGAYDRSSYSGSTAITQFAGDGHNMPPPHPAQALNYGQPPSRPTSRTSHKRSISPNGGRGRRSESASANPPPMKKSRSRSGFKSRGSSTHGSFADNHSDAMNGYSSGDGAPGSVSSKTRSEHLGNTEISLDNIVEGGRRKRAKFESSELPLFAPPQMPAATSNSSVSPARRMEHQRSSFPFTNPSHNPFSNPQTLQSPQSYGNGYGQPGIYSTPAALDRRTRGGASYPTNRQSIGSTPTGNSSGILPTPDPTVGSCMSEEDKDVALQLMRLGEMSNISHGRTSASTFADDTFSGKADAASSCATSDDESESENELPPARRQKREASPVMLPELKKFRPHLNDLLPSQDSTEPSADEGDYEERDGTFQPGIQDDLPKVTKSKSLPVMGKPRTTASGAKVKSMKPKTSRPGQIKSKKSNSVPGSTKPISPTSLAPQSRKASNASALNFQHQLATDEEDLSSKPRCQRCRKSKKGCDRQRPCQRCKDAGLSADQCVSEDEGNGRKGRYGRHMGVPVKKDHELGADTPILPPIIMAGGQGSPDKSKKRKR